MNPFNRLHRREPAWDEVEQGEFINSELRRIFPIMTIHERHMQLIDAVNNCTNKMCHTAAANHLDSWRDGMRDAGVTLDLIGADLHQMDRGINRPMCAGVFLDWSEAGETKP